MATATWYGLGLEKAFTSTATDQLNWTTDTFKIALVTATYAPNQDTDNYANLAGFTGNELSGGGYARQTLGGKTLTYDGASNTIRFKCSDPSWTSFTGTWRYGVIFKDTGTASTSPLVGLVDYGSNQTVSAATHTLNFDTTDGALRIVLA